MNNAQLTLSQVFAAVLSHKAKCFIVFASVAAMVVGLFLIWPKKYGSEGKLYVQVGRNETNISPTSQSVGISIQDTRETEIKSVEELIRSRVVLEAVVQQIGPDEFLKSPLDGLLPSIKFPSLGGSSEGQFGDDKLDAKEYQRLKKIEAAVKQLEDSVVIFNQKKTSVISVYVNASSPRLAQRTVNEIFNEVRRIHSKVHAVPGSSAFFREKVEESAEILENAMAKQEKFRGEREMLSVEAARGSLQNIISSLEKDIVDTSVEVSQLEKKILRLNTELKRTPERIMVETTGVERKSGDDAQVAFFSLQDERTRLLGIYQPTHPEVVKIDDRIRKMKSKLDAMDDDRTQKTFQINNVHEELKVELVRAEATSAGAKARLASIESRLQESHKKLLVLNHDEIVGDRLQRLINTTRADWEMYVTKGREAEANQSLDKSNLSTLVVAQEPSFILKHASPKGSLFLPVGVMLGLLAGLATALFCERNHLSGSLNETEVEGILEMPILVTLPRVYSSRNMVN